MNFVLVAIGVGVNVAVTDCDVFSVTLQVPTPTHAPDQPLKVDPDCGVAERVITVLTGKDAVHNVPQLIPVGDETTDPLPAPDLRTVRVWLPELAGRL